MKLQERKYELYKYNTDNQCEPNVEQRVVYSIYYNGTLVLPWRGERGVALAGLCLVRVE